MPSVRGLALMSRLEYFEFKYGLKEYKKFLKNISTEDLNFSRQPVDGAHIYPDRILAEIDRILLEEYFENDLAEFFLLGKWGAENFMYRYFSLYVDNHDPQSFLIQYGRLRDALLGSGDMSIQKIDDQTIKILIEYGQKIPKSVCLSEQGFIEGGMVQCGAENVKIEEKVCASESDAFICEFHVKFKST